MNVLLIHPTYYSSPDCNPKSIYRSTPPLGLGYLASILRNAGHTVMLFDIMGRDGELPKRLEYFKPEVIAISTMTTSYPQAFKTCVSLREMGYQGRIVMGGVHPTLEPHKTFQQLSKYIDAIVVGEGEGAILTVVSEKKKGIITTAPVDNLDHIPFPAWEMFELKRYSTHYLPILTSRGCPFDCIFCSSKHYWNNVRYRSIANVEAEIKFLKEHGAQHIMFYDDTFVLDKNRVRAINQICRDNGMFYRCNGRINILHDDSWNEILDEMRGVCVQIDIGVESYSQSVLDTMNKHIAKEQIIPTIEKIHSRKIGVNCYLIISNVGETDRDRQATLRFANYIKMLYPGVHVDLQLLRVYPKTPLAERVNVESVDWTADINPELRYPNVPLYLEKPEDRAKIIAEFKQAKELIVGW